MKIKREIYATIFIEIGEFHNYKRQKESKPS